ncbi:hypothetical protein PCASD_07904 [Puccinia coronata f. sp. avenae]|uniref:Uncharacterized protein n=1 Tax=Puccinia coronata f. sp. avenae TaxID=200324 RepID=A0A2N5UQ24_9BASI|nr:hypothetical protein PCASD_07904 [Puccinia coronata f. sp. avenae]
MNTTTHQQQDQLEQDQLAANELLATVDLNLALQFIHSSTNNSHTQPTTNTQSNTHIQPITSTSTQSLQQAAAHQSPNSLDIKTSPGNPAAATQPQPTQPNEHPPTASTSNPASPSRNQRLKTISISILRTVSRKRDLSSGEHPGSPPASPSVIQSLPPALQSILTDHHHQINHLVKRPSFIVDVRSVTAAAERHQANPNQIRRVEECKRFFSLRYEPIFTALAEEKPPPSLVKVAEWRRKLQLVSILRKKIEQSLISSSSYTPSSSPRQDHEPTHSEALKMKLRMNTDQSTPLSILTQRYDTYKWICLSSRKRRTMWEVCPEDIQAYMSAQGTIEDEEELQEAERLFGQFDESPIHHPKSSRQRVQSHKTSRWYHDTNPSSSQPSDNDSTRSPASVKSHHYHIRKPSSGASSSPAIRATDAFAYTEASPSVPRISDLTSIRHSSDTSSPDKPTGGSRIKAYKPSNTRLRSSSEIDERDSRKSQADHGQPNPPLAVDFSNMTWSDKAQVSSPLVSSAIPLSPLETSFPRASTSALRDDYCTPPQSKTNALSNLQTSLAFPSSIPSRHSSDHGPRQHSSKPSFDVKSKVKKYHSAWSATDDANSPSGPSPFRSNHSQPRVSCEPVPSRQSKQRLSNLGRGMTSSSHSIPNHNPGSPEKLPPNLSRATSAKGLLSFAKRSIIPDGSTSSLSPLTPPDRLPLQAPRPAKLSFFNKPPRDWRGWKFDKSHLIFRSNHHNHPNKKPIPILIPPVNDILFARPFHQPLRTPNYLPKTAMTSFAHQQSISLPILITDLTDEEVQEIEMLIVMMTSQLEHGEIRVKESGEAYRKYTRLLPQIRQEIGLSEIDIRMLDDGRRMENEDMGEGASDKGKQVQSESIKSSSSTSTEGSVLSQSVHHDDQEEEPARLLHAAGTAAAGEGQATSRIEQFSEHLDDSLARIDRTLEDLERSKLAFRDSLIQQIEARRLAIHKHEIYLASCSERQELMRKDRELVNQMKRTVKVFGQEGRMIDHVLQAITNGISRPLISGVVSVLTKMIGIGLKLFSLHSEVYARPVPGLVWSLGARYLYTSLGRNRARLWLAVWSHLPSLHELHWFHLFAHALEHWPPRIALYLERYNTYTRLATRVFSLAVNTLVCLNFSLLLTSLIGLLWTTVFHHFKPPPPPFSSSSSSSSTLHPNYHAPSRSIIHNQHPRLHPHLASSPFPNSPPSTSHPSKSH